MMIGQLKFAWIDFRRTFISSIFAYLSQIIAYSSITISIGLFSISKPLMYMRINNTFYTAYRSLIILFLITSLIIGAVTIWKSIDLKFKNQKDDIIIMKNVGGKSRWIYSYFVFSQILTASILLIVGIIVGIFTLIVALNSLGIGSLFIHIKFIPVLLSNVCLLIVSYLKAHSIIIKFIGDKNFEISSNKLSNYKSIFEFSNLIKKIRAPSKLGVKNFLRSNAILVNFIFIFFLVFSSTLFIIGPLTIDESHNQFSRIRYEGSSYIVGDSEINNFYKNNLEANLYANTTISGELEDEQFFSNLTLDGNYLSEIDSLGIDYYTLFISKQIVKEIPYTDVDLGSYNIIGEDRTFYATIIGYNEDFLSEELFMRESFPESNEESVVIGDSLEAMIFENSSLEKIQLTEGSVKYEIRGVIVDPFASSFTVYVPISRLIQESITNGSNLVIFNDLDEIEREQIQEMSTNYGYQLEDVRNSAEIYHNSLKETVFATVTIGASLFIIFSIQSSIFALLYVLAYRKDSELLFKLGIKKRKIKQSNNISILLHLIPGALLGSYFGTVLTLFFLIPKQHMMWLMVLIVPIVIWFIITTITGSQIANNRIIKKIKKQISKTSN